MQKVSEYTLVENGTLELLERDVNQRIKQGWVPSGTVVTHGGQLLQAMVKFEDA